MKNTKKYHMLTLLELIIALGIVAALASLFLDNMADTKARACEDHTIRKGEQLQAVITGGEARGFSDFLSDMGRWPRVYIPEESKGGDQGTDDSIRGGRRLAEFYDPAIWYQNEVSGTGFKSALSHEETLSGEDIQKILRHVPGSTIPAPGAAPALYYPEVSMTFGWRGPYVNLSRPLGAKYFDGWGRSWKIVTNYNMKVTSNRLEENESGAKPLEVKDAFAKNEECRIDGVVSYGADGVKDAAGAAVLPSDADRKFIFAHPMDVFQKNRLASLNIRLMVKDAGGSWTRLGGPEFTKSWEDEASGHLYKVGDLVNHEVSGGAGGSASVPHLFVCKAEHSRSTSWEEAKWIDLSSTSLVIHKPLEGFDTNYPADTLRIHDEWVWIKNNGNTESASDVNSTNWTKLFEVNAVADNLDILLFVPVMQKSGDDRYLKLGQYHFYANSTGTNYPGVVPGCLNGSGIDKDVDAEDTTAADLKKNYSVGGGNFNAGYNPRYLVAETEWKSWSELQVERLVPGRRKIFCAFFNKKTSVYQTSEVQLLELKPGDNFIELRLEKRN